jgi:hypothetical protein
MTRIKAWAKGTFWVCVPAYLAATLYMALAQRPDQQQTSPQATTDARIQEILASIRDMRLDVARFKSQHDDIFIELARLSQHVTDLEGQVVHQRDVVESLDPSKAGERLVKLETFVTGQEKKADTEATATAVRWSQATNALYGLVAGWLLNELRKYILNKHKAYLALEAEKQRLKDHAELITKVAVVQEKAEAAYSEANTVNRKLELIGVKMADGSKLNPDA